MKGFAALLRVPTTVTGRMCMRVRFGRTGGRTAFWMSAYSILPAHRTAFLSQDLSTEGSKERRRGNMESECAKRSLGLFTPIVLSSLGGMGPEAATFFRRMACLLAEKNTQHFSVVMGWLRTPLCTLLLRCSTMCLRGRRRKRRFRGLCPQLNPEMAHYDCRLSV